MRVDDDTVLDPLCLSELYTKLLADEEVIGTAPVISSSGVLVDSEYYTLNVNDWPSPRIHGQMTALKTNKRHFTNNIYSMFMYKRQENVNYPIEIGYSQKCHTEETVFSYLMSKKGKIEVIPTALCHHMRCPQGGIRAGNNDQKQWDSDLQKGFKLMEDNGLKKTKTVQIPILPQNEADYFKLITESFDFTKVDLVEIFTNSPKDYEGRPKVQTFPLTDLPQNASDLELKWKIYLK
jgi:hypothetical protein